MKIRRIPLILVIPAVLILLIACLWPWTIRHADQLIYRAGNGNTYALATHPHGIAYIATTHGRELEELWRPHQPALPSGLAFDSFKWGELRSVTFFGMAVPGAGTGGGPAVFSRTDVRRWETPEHDFLGLGWVAEVRTIGPPIPPDPLTYERRVVSVPFWAMLLVLLYLPLAWARRRFLASRPRPPRPLGRLSKKL